MFLRSFRCKKAVFEPDRARFSPGVIVWGAEWCEETLEITLRRGDENGEEVLIEEVDERHSNCIALCERSRR